jgi:hypothetical protein
MNKKSVRSLVAVGAVTLCLPFFQNCDMGKPVQANSSSSTAALGAGEGNQFSGTGSTSVPTGPAVIARVTNGLQNNVNPSAGNYSKAIVALGSNLPRVTDPTKASGYDQIQLLVYAACSDLTTGGTNSLMTTKYGVNSAGTITSNSSALTAAGVKMFDQYTAGLASQGPTAAQVTAAFTQLISDVSSVSSNTSTIAFVSVCIAANTAGTTLLGF